MKLTFRSAAYRDIADAAEYYESMRPGLGRDFLRQLKLATGLIRQQPYAGKLVADYSDLHELQIKQFPYRIIYRLNDRQMEVLAVYHQKRHPEHWQDRIQEEPAIYQLAA